MPTHIQNLPLPSVSNNRNSSSGDSDDDTVSSWDSTYQRPPTEQNFALQQQQHPQICSHAVSIGHHVFGIRNDQNHVNEGMNDNDDDEIDTSWWTWQRSLADVNKPLLSSGIGIINTLRSNSNGTVIAVASDTGVVSLLRGCDGQILATRRVVGTNPSSSTDRYTIRLSWIAGSIVPQSDDHSNTDILLIEVPCTDEDCSKSSSNSQLILVANINGRQLNDSDPNVVTEAVRNTQIIPIDMSTTTPYDIRAFIASRIFSNETIRLMACDGDSHLVILDFDRVSHDLKLVQDGISLQLHSKSIESKLDYTIDFELGFYQQVIPNECLIMCSAFVDPTEPMIAWFSPLARQTVCVYTLPQPKVQYPPPINSKVRKGIISPISTTSKVIAMEAISSWDNNEAMATAVAVKSIQKSGITTMTSVTTIYVVQISLDDTFGLTSFGRPHLVYAIPMEETVMSLHLASFGWGNESIFPYAFRYQVGTDSTTNGIYKKFQTDRMVGTSIGKLRTNIHRNNFREADKIVEKIGLMSLTMELYADFHPSEIVLHRLQSVFHQTTVATNYDDSIPGNLIDDIKFCLRELVHGVILKSGRTGNTLGFDLFVQSIETLTEKVSTTNMTLQTFHQCLLEIASSIQSVIPNIDNNIHTEKLELHRRAILEQSTVLDYLSSCSSQPKVLVPFHDIRSLPHLYEICIQEQHFAMAENTFRSSRKASCWSTAALVKPLLQYITGATIAPKEYLFLLQDVIFANLVVNDGMLARLKTWSCRIADALDDSNTQDRDLDAAILLLKNMDAGIRKLQLRIHGSFASYSPFSLKYMETRHPINRRPSPKSNSSGEVNSSDMSKINFSFGTQLPSKHKKYMEGPLSFQDEPIPTILERTALQGGPTNSSAATVKSYNSGDDDSVQAKLLHAECLKDARELGLGRKNVSLHDFVSYGGPKRIARDLIQLLSSSVETHKNRKQMLKEQCLPFCRRYFVEYDDVLHDCVVDICRSKTVGISSLEECCSISRCCTSLNLRCQITLTILQAALNCGRTCESLFSLSKEAIDSWAPKDTSVQSELQEALRLLQIDDIILRYCGAGARELFRVSDPRHASNLLQFLTQQIERDAIVDDVMALCDAFNNLCAYEATRTLIENSILDSDSQLCLLLFNKLEKKNVEYAEHAIVSAVNYAEVILTECSYSIHTDLHNSRREIFIKRASRVCDQILALLRLAMERSLTFSSKKSPTMLCNSGDMSLHNLQAIYLRIQRLQKDHSVYVATAAMYQPSVIISRILPFLETVAQRGTISDCPQAKNELSNASAICSLLTMLSKGEERDIWVTASTLAAVKMVRAGNYNRVLQFLSSAGLESNLSNRLHALCHVAVTGVLCETNMQNSSSSINAIHPVLFASALLTNWSISTVTAKDLAVVLEVAGHLDVVCQVFCRCDEGVGESVDPIRSKLRCQSLKDSLPANCDELHLRESITYKTDIHPSWYIGDGILLPPSDAIKTVTLFWNEQVCKNNAAHDGTIDLYDLLKSCGVLSLALRILCESSSVMVSILHEQNADGIMASIRDSYDETISSLLERNLGGSGSGITNFTIDSQQAAMFLLKISPKRAFLAYKSCLPTSIKMQNFERLQNLSNVGLVASSGGETKFTSSDNGVGWKNQQKFLAQCQQLSTEAKWWRILQFYGIEFDSHLFSDKIQANECEANYATSLLPVIISKAFKVLDSSQVLALSLQYSVTFEVPCYRAATAIIEYTLLRSDKLSEKSDHRYPDEETVRTSLEYLAPLARCRCLRRCLMNIENDGSFQDEYEHVGLLLGLYHDSLTFVLDSDQSMQHSFLETELEKIERRRDVLVILTSIFHRGRIVTRPKFFGFFPPLPETLGHTSVVRNCGVLGKKSPHCTEEFDPLEPLQQVFSSMHEVGVVTALASLCSPLSIPNGYVHARSLMARFMLAQNGEVEFPSFTNDLTPVLRKLPSASDRAALADWCTTQYKMYDNYKLNCFTEFLNATIAASTEIEQRRRHFPNDKILKQQERDFLERIRSITSVKSTLSDFLHTTNMLRSLTTSVPKIMEQLVDGLILELEQTIKKTPVMTPEAMVDFLFTTGSHLASDTCLKGESSFPIDYFRQYCSIIHSACCDIANHYSHIDVTDRARRLAHCWLFFGDESISTVHLHANSLAAPNPLRGFNHTDEESTVDFVMDLSSVDTQQRADYNHQAKVQVNGHESRTNSLEERSSLHLCTFRELSDAVCHRSALRIAFVLAFSPPKQVQTTDKAAQKENTDINQYLVTGSSTSKRLGLLAKRVARDSSNVYDLGSELLRIVFAKSGSSSNALQHFQRNTLVTSEDDVATDIPSTITFAMRHRALRVAAILCPQEILEEIVRTEGILTLANNLEPLSLRQCSYGTFIAKEIEEMGLPLPHSELLQLSSMHFLSYARSLWRDHRDDSILDKSKGRFYLLLIELCLHNDRTDPQFVSQLLDEMARRNQTRSLLQALEQVVEYEARVVESTLSIIFDSVKKAIASAVTTILSDLKTGIANQKELFGPCPTDLISTIERLNKIILSMLDADEAIAHYTKFIDMLSPVKEESTLEALLTMTRQYRERAERYIGSVSTS